MGFTSAPAIQDSGDVDHQQTTNRTHDQDDITPASVDTDSVRSDALRTSTDIGTDTTREQELYQLAPDHSAYKLIQKTQVSTTAVPILTAPSPPAVDIAGAAITITGREPGTGDTEFFDLLTFLHSVSGFTLVESESGASAAARNYSVSGRALELAMGANTYEITAVGHGGGTVA